MTATATDHGPAYRPLRRAGLSTVEIDGETVVYAPDSDALHRLGPTASIAWSRMTGSVTLTAMADDLAALHHADPDDVLRDLLGLTRDLAHRGLLAGTDAAPEYTGRRRDSAQPEPVVATTTVDERPLPVAPYRTRPYRAIGHAFTVATNDEGVRAYLEYVFADLPAGTDAAPGSYQLLTLDAQRTVLTYGGDILATVDRVDRALSLLLWHVNTESARTATAGCPVVHAAAAVRRGSTVLLPAPQESGKTTTVAGLVRVGFGYLTDEAVPIDTTTLLPVPYPKALSIDSGSWEVLADLRPRYADRMRGQWQVPATSVRVAALADPAPIRFVVMPSYQRGAGTELAPVARAETLVALADSTFHFWDAPQRNLDVLARVLEPASCYRLTLSDLAEGVRLIDELVASEQFDVAE